MTFIGLHMSVMGDCSVQTSNVRLLGKLVADWENPHSGAGRFPDDLDNEVFNAI